MKLWKKIISGIFAVILSCGTLSSAAAMELTEESENQEIAVLSAYTGNRDWKWPVPDSASLSSCYLDGRAHHALDIAAPKGTAVYASYPGTVISTSMACSHNYGKTGSCGCNGDMGNYIFIRHNYNGVNFVSRYIHMTKVNVSSGDKVTKDTIIGTVGSTGSSRGFHLDFRIYQGSSQSSNKSTCVDPLKDQFLEMPSTLNANAANTECCRTYVKEVKAIYAKPIDGDGGLPFKDVPKGSWFYDAVSYVYDNKIMSGMTEDMFYPEEMLTRSQFAALLYRLEKSPSVTYKQIFEDVPKGQWYSNAVIWASQKGIVSGYAGQPIFGTNDYITREQIAVMMYRYAEYKGYDVSEKGSIDSFEDKDEITAYAFDALKWAVGAGIFSGKDTDTLAPLGNTYRAECASIFMRFMKRIK